ncbi:nucleotidyl transferase AbiEii/AbiGii toxin family protein [Actinacidiphila glaucinigra]|uniref:nucleotidyl transferase AbiEii/AbiGii toxin family protein n=1 Tax=Actinacidiphila glaucinigra TaxID=235986 RepID=UPI002E345093|nr:nucleotidyl transferase AbiEii/AbiGii toxin family protein [Actinacidiphila glaucinigra]
MSAAAPRDRSAVARRAVLDHLLGLVARSPLAEYLVLRGSMVMPAWVGAAAREPGDLDWIVRPSLAVPIEPLHPYPYVDERATVQQWPEAADGAARPEIWTDEEFGTGGQRVHVPPEGLHWIVDPEPDGTDGTDGPPGELLELVRAHPDAAPGIRLDAKAARDDGSWTYAGYDTPGVRLVIPWHADGLPPGEVSLDFARDERLPEPPVLTAVPRGDGGPPAVVLTASRELSLAWKLLWLQDDAAAEGRAQGKDLYDAVLLAEAPGTALTHRLLRRVMSREPGHPASAPRLTEVTPHSVDWDTFRAACPHVTGTAAEWLARLSRALDGALADGR